jgi:hypothetical protein
MIVVFEDIVAVLERAFSLELKVVSFVETALFWSRAIADFRSSGEGPGTPSRDFRMMEV